MSTSHILSKDDLVIQQQRNSLLSLNELCFLEQPVNMVENNQNEDEFLKSIRTKMENKELVSIYINLIDKNYNMFGFIKGHSNYRCVIKESEVDKTLKLTRRSDLTNKEYYTFVTDIDNDDKTIYCSYSQAKEHQRDKAIKSIKSIIDGGSSVKIPAKIIHVKFNPIKNLDPTRPKKENIVIRLDIGGLGIQGIMPIQQFSHKYIDDPKHVEIGKVENVMIYSYGYSDEQKKKIFFKCSRKELIPNPWIDIENKIPKNTTLTVTCVETLPDKFYGEIEGYEELYVFCQYPDKSKNIMVVKGQKYNVFIYDVNEEKRKLTARVIEAADK